MVPESLVVELPLSLESLVLGTVVEALPSVVASVVEVIDAPEDDIAVAFVIVADPVPSVSPLVPVSPPSAASSSPGARRQSEHRKAQDTSS